MISESSQFIIDKYDSMSPGEIAEILGLSYRSVTARAHLLRSRGLMPPAPIVKKNRPWTTTEERWLIENYRPGLCPAAAAHLQRTECSVRERVRLLRHAGRLPTLSQARKEVA